MIRLLMYGGQKNKAITIFFETVSKILEKKRLEKSQGSSAVRKYRLYYAKDSSIIRGSDRSFNRIEWLGFKPSQFTKVLKGKPADTMKNMPTNPPIISPVGKVCSFG